MRRKGRGGRCGVSSAQGGKGDGDDDGRDGDDDGRDDDGDGHDVNASSKKRWHIE